MHTARTENGADVGEQPLRAVLRVGWRCGRAGWNPHGQQGVAEGLQPGPSTPPQEDPHGQMPRFFTRRGGIHRGAPGPPGAGGRER